jgi:hypothetical protein
MPEEDTISPDDMLAEFDLSPDDWTVVSGRRSAWQRPDGEWLEAKRVSIARAHPETNVTYIVK